MDAFFSAYIRGFLCRLTRFGEWADRFPIHSVRPDSLVRNETMRGTENRTSLAVLSSRRYCLLHSRSINILSITYAILTRGRQRTGDSSGMANVSGDDHLYLVRKVICPLKKSIYLGFEQIGIMIGSGIRSENETGIRYRVGTRIEIENGTGVETKSDTEIRKKSVSVIETRNSTSTRIEIGNDIRIKRPPEATTFRNDVVAENFTVAIETFALLDARFAEIYSYKRYGGGWANPSMSFHYSQTKALEETLSRQSQTLSPHCRRRS
ncbi:hypothetical protein EVAR_26727_1 [Eumeta japonica]|uniref:Uncharacterized protein n=1 Tax=Eumeta variegata TaxID=151549 RepID=A0A4C1XDQ1_EUMVA|nr:hypothetical protein EVAR_26727_1 [Eumeta japonica]